MTTQKTKVFWSQEEKARLCEEAGRLLYTLQASSKLMALEQAQANVLPAERHRKIVTIASIPWFTEGVQRELEKCRREVQAESASPETPPALPATLAQMYPQLRQLLVSELAALVSDVLKEIEWPTQAQGLLQVLQLGATRQTPPTREGAAAESPSIPTALGHSKRTSVLVVGLRGGQMDEVKRAFDSRLDLRFFGADESKDKLRSMSEQVDLAVAMTDFISHSHEDIMLKKARKYIRSAGGMTRLKELLSTFVPQQPEAQAA
jgi:hypothetical protein